MHPHFTFVTLDSLMGIQNSTTAIFCSSTGPRFTQDASWKCFSQSSHLTAFSAALQYFLHVRHWNLGPGFISISPAKIIRINKFGTVVFNLWNPLRLIRTMFFTKRHVYGHGTSQPVWKVRIMYNRTKHRWKRIDLFL